MIKKPTDDAHRCCWPHCRRKIERGNGVVFLGKLYCDYHWELLASQIKQKGESYESQTKKAVT